MDRIGIEGKNTTFGIFRAELGELTHKPTLKELNSGKEVYWERLIIKDGVYSGFIKYRRLSRDDGIIWIKLEG